MIGEGGKFKLNNAFDGSLLAGALLASFGYEVAVSLQEPFDL